MEQIENTAPAATTEVDSEVETTSGAGSAPAGNEAPASGDDTSNWTEKAQKRYDELTRERYEAAARADRAEYRLQEAERRLAEREAAAKTETVAPSNDYPTLESAGWDEGKHATMVAAWSAKQAREAARAELNAERTQAEAQRATAEHSRREAEFLKAKPDYAEKVMRPPALGGPAITDAMADVIRSSDIGPEVAYYLAENVAKSLEIARLPPHLQAREIGRIEARLEAAKVAPPPVSKAPPPAPTLNANESSVDKDPSTMSDTEFAKWRKRQIAQRR